ncbi:2-hydroxyglutaryl-CoA dehydratase [Candidatus Woesearchaeota archaeon]|nr:2-hydroxyglutaryl-CoA dehydratase [Candidatus Woesearchaeota archaeon]
MENKEVYLGIDCGSVTTKAVLLDKKKNLISFSYRKNKDVLTSIRECFDDIKLENFKVLGCGVTGSGRNFIKIILSADIAQTEILAHTIAALEHYPDVRTILDIGGEDCKLITIDDGIFSNFSMNSICAAGTGSVIENISERLDVKIEDFGDLALQSKKELNLPGKCGIFLSSAVVSRKNLGYDKSDILMGVCKALIRNYLTVCGKNIKLNPPFVFQGGVSLNKAVVKALEEELKHKVIVPKYNTVMGAIGMALLVKEKTEKSNKKTSFDSNFKNKKLETENFKCTDCANRCEVTQIYKEGHLLGAVSTRCGKWESMKRKSRA